MGRLLGITSIAALAGALFYGVAAASTLSSPQPIDLRSQYMLALFGETSDAGAALAAAYGDRASESPLRNLALGSDAGAPAGYGIVWMPSFSVATIPGHGALGLDLLAAARARGRAMVDEAGFAPVQQPSPDLERAGKEAASRLTDASHEDASYIVGTYQPAGPLTAISPEPGSQSFAPLRAPQPSAVGSGLLATAGSVPGSQTTGASLSQTLRVGPERFQGRAEGASLQAPQVALDEASYGAGANFDVRAGARDVNVDVSSSYEHLLRNDATTFSPSSVGSSGWQLPGDDVPLAVPNYADMSKLAVGANVAVPVVKGLTLNLNYDAARLLGGYGLPGVTNLDAIDNSYGGGFTFNIPRFSSTLSVSARQQHYQDNILPANTTTTTRADVNLTVKF